MRLTESDAKKKWCPLVRQLGTLKQPPLAGATDYVVASGSQHRGYAVGGALDNCRCIASECMAWRWNGRQPEVCSRGHGRFARLSIAKRILRSIWNTDMTYTKSAAICRAALARSPLTLSRNGMWAFGKRMFSPACVKWLIGRGEAVRVGNV